MSWTRIAVLVGVLLLAAGCGLPTTTTGAPPTRSTSAPGSPGTALDRLAIAPDGPLTGYDR